MKLLVCEVDRDILAMRSERTQLKHCNMELERALKAHRVRPVSATPAVWRKGVGLDAGGWPFDAWIAKLEVEEQEGEE